MALDRLTKLLLGATVAMAANLVAPCAHADPNACASNATVGLGCSNAGSTGNQFGTCQMTAASHGPGCQGEEADAAAESDAAVGSTCLTCIASTGEGNGCGSEGPGGLSGAQFFQQPQVAGCCSVAGRSDWAGGLGLVAGACLLGLVFVQRRRRLG